MSKFSLVIPTMGVDGLLECALASLEHTQTRDYQICIGRDPGGVNGMHKAIDDGIQQAQGDWIVLAHDDVVFLPGWDEFSVDENWMFRLEALDRKGLTWPPVVDAGDEPSNFQQDIANVAAVERRQQRWGFAAGGPFLDVVVVFHRSRWVPWPAWTDEKYRTHDVAWWIETRRRHPDLMFGWWAGNCIYHFVHGSVRHKTQPKDILDGPLDTFVKRYGMTVEQAGAIIYSNCPWGAIQT